jgi:hypothetical protein
MHLSFSFSFSQSLLLSSLATSNHVTGANISFHTHGSNKVASHLFLIASLLPILRAGLTNSVRFTFPISIRFNFDGLGSFSIQSGTGEPDWERTFAMLLRRILLEKHHGEKNIYSRLQIRRVLVGEVSNCLPFSASSTGTT